MFKVGQFSVFQRLFIFFLNVKNQKNKIPATFCSLIRTICVQTDSLRLNDLKGFSAPRREFSSRPDLVPIRADGWRPRGRPLRSCCRPEAVLIKT